MKNTLLILLSFICTIYIVFSIFNNSSHPKFSKIDDVNIHYIKFSAKTVDFLKNRSDYSKLYKQNKKFVVYAHSDYCPKIKRIEDTVKELIKNDRYAEYYNFYMQDAPGYKTFESKEDMKSYTTIFYKCNAFCIINPRTNELFTLSGNMIEVALNLNYILDKMKSW